MLQSCSTEPPHRKPGWKNNTVPGKERCQVQHLQLKNEGFVEGLYRESVNQDLECYERDIIMLFYENFEKPSMLFYFITTLTCLINLDFGAIRDFI